MPNLLTKDTSAEASQSEKLLSTPASSSSVGKPVPHPDHFSLVPHCSFYPPLLLPFLAKGRSVGLPWPPFGIPSTRPQSPAAGTSPSRLPNPVDFQSFLR